MTDNLPERIYTETDLARTRRNAKAVGWVQGGLAVLLGAMVLNLLGWIPAVAVAGGVVYLGYKILTWGSGDDEE
jgi:MFS superfamily sulfate permease-like transporter